MLTASNSIHAIMPKDYDGTLGKKVKKIVGKERNPSSESTSEESKKER